MIISVTKDNVDKYKSVVKCDMIRGVSDFEDFEIEINDNGLPIIREMLTMAEYPIKDMPF